MEEISSLNEEIVSAVAAGVRGGDPIDEIQDMFIDTSSFYRVLENWKDSQTKLNLLQTAVVYLRYEVVKFLCCLEEKNKVTFPSEYHESVCINYPFHLACKAGAINIVKYMVENDNIAGLESLRCPTVLRLPSIITYDSNSKSTSNGDQLENNLQYPKPMIPFEVCVQEGHLECANYLCKLIVSIRCSLGYLEELPLHRASYLGNAGYLKLLLDNGYKSAIHVKDRNGYTALHIAASNSECECVEVLLQHGASANAIAKCRSALHLLYGESIRAEQFAECTQLLVKYGISVNAVDHNNNSPLDYLAWEYGQRQLPHSNQKMDRYWYTRANLKRSDFDLSVEKFQHEVLKCMEILLQAGAHTTVRITTVQEMIDHTIVHTLLQNTGWPLNSCILKSPLVVYRGLALLFHYGADPNALAKNNNTSSFTMLILHSLHEMQSMEVKCSFMHLFIMNCASLETPIPPPQNFREYHADRLWSVYPVMLALQEKHPIEVICLMFSYMSLPHINNALRCGKMRRWFSILMDAGDKTYKRQWKQLQKDQRQPRTLKHMCKLACLKPLYMKADLVDLLPLPTAIKKYLKDMMC